jgi:hypothetical protein
MYERDMRELTRQQQRLLHALNEVQRAREHHDLSRTIERALWELHPDPLAVRVEWARLDGFRSREPRWERHLASRRRLEELKARLVARRSAASHGVAA